MDLARHSTPDMTINVYGRSRWERRSGLVESRGEAPFFRPGTHNHNTTEGRCYSIFTVDTKFLISPYLKQQVLSLLLRIPMRREAGQ